MGTARFDIREVERLIVSLQETIERYKDNAEALNSSFEHFVTNDSFTGKSANASKLYMTEVEMVMLEDILEIHQLLFDMHVHMYDSFKEKVDQASNARIDVDAIEEEKDDFHRFSSEFEESARKIETKASSIATRFGHLANFIVPNSLRTEEAFDDVIGGRGFLAKCIDKFQTFDSEESSYEKSKNFQERIKEISDKIVRIDQALNSMKVFEPSFGVYDIFLLVCGSAKVASAKYMSYISKMHTFLLGKQKNSSICLYDPVNLCNGNYINECVDITLGGRYKLEFKRFYNAISGKKGTFGLGWTHNYDEYLSVKQGDTDKEESIRVVFGDGSEGVFVRRGNYYLEENGLQGILEKLPIEDAYVIRQDNGDYKKFDSEGRLTSLGDSSGEHTTLFYEKLLSGTRRLVTVKAKNGNSLRFEYYKNYGDDINGEKYAGNSFLIKSVTDHTGRVVKYSYGNDKLSEVVAPDGAVRNYIYDKAGRIKDIINPRGITAISNEYDRKGRITRQSFPDKSEMIYEYDDDKRTVMAIEQNGNKVIYTHDELERHTKTTYFDGEERFTYNLRNQKTSIVDKNGNITHLAYDRKGHLTKVIDALGNTTSVTYNAEGKPMAVKGPKGEEYRYSYDVCGKLCQVKNPLGETSRISYRNGNISKIIDPNGSETLFEYDDRGNIKSVTDPDGVKIGYDYDALNRVIAKYPADGTKTVFEYDDADRIVKVTDAFGNTREYVYDKSGKVTLIKEKDGTVKNYKIDVRGHISKVIDEAGRETRITYDSMGMQEEVLYPNGGLMRYEYDPLMRLAKVTDPEGRTRKYSYDPNGNVTEEYVGDIRIRKKEYDALNRVIKETDALGHKKSFSYDKNGKVNVITDAQGNQYTRDYDILGRVVKETDPLGNSTVYSYTKLGNIECVIDPAERERRFEYTAAGKLSAVYFCGMLEQSLAYDNCGRISKRTLADGYEILYSYDALSHISKIQASDGRSVAYEYDAMGRVERLIDGKSITSYTYTATGCLKSVIDALGNETAYSYDALDNLQSIHRMEGLASEDERNGEYFPTVGRDGHVTLYSYNLAGQLTNMTDALGQKEIYKYDQYGRLKEKIDRDNYATTYDYSDTGAVTKVMYGDGRSVEFAYDELNHIRQINDWLGMTKLENDILGRLVKVTDYLDRTVSYEYGKNGKKTKLTYPDGSIVNYIYDEEGRLTSITGNGEETKYSYDDIGRLSEKLLPNGIIMGYSYLPGGYLESMTSSDGKGELDKYLYRYNNAGLIVGIDRNRRDIEAVSGRYEYQYDAIGRLLMSSYNGQMRASYEYDAYGNRLGLFENEVSTTYTYDVLDRILETKGLSSSSTIVKTYDYDNRGNQTKEYIDGILSKTYIYDSTNMLSKVLDTDKGELKNQYNGLGFRVSSVMHDEKIEYLCDLSRDYYNLLERTVNGEKERFVYDNNVVSMNKLGHNYYYLQDELGSPMYMTGTDGEVLSSYAFDDFGRDIDPMTGRLKTHGYMKDGNILQPFAFAGYQEDEISGLKFAQARFYSAENGRFLGEDQVKGTVMQPDSLNRYLYCFNDARNQVDGNGKNACGINGIYWPKGWTFTLHDTLHDALHEIIPPELFKVVDVVFKYSILVPTGAWDRYEKECNDNATGKTLEQLQENYDSNLPDYTDVIDSWLQEQEDYFDSINSPWSILLGPLSVVQRGILYYEFYEKVKTGGSMDIKQPEKWREAFGFDRPEGYFIYHGQVMDAATLGNVTYSYIGAKYFSDFELYSGGAAVQVKRYHWPDLIFMYLLPYWGDMDEDHEAIELGIKWRKEGFPCDG